METTDRNTGRTRQLFEELGGIVNDGFPAIHSPVHHTHIGTPYLKGPGVVVLARPQTNVAGLAGFLEGFDPDLRFPEYLDDPTELPDSSQLCKTSGQVCYASFGPRRSKNDIAAAYFERLTSAGHGCYDGETEVLTAAGWKRWTEVSEEDEFATLNHAHEIEYHHPFGLVRYRHVGRMYRVESSGVDLLVTPNHRMYACPTTTRAGRRREGYRLLRCEELGDGPHAYLKTGRWHEAGGGSTVVYALLGFAVGDGHTVPGSSKLRFRLRRERKITWLRATCRELGWSLVQSGERFTVSVPAEWRRVFVGIYGRSGEKTLPQKLLVTLPRSALEGLLDGLLEADGCRTKTGDCYDTTSEVLAGQVQQLCLHVGLAANLSQADCYKERDTSFGDKPIYRVHIVRRNLKPEVNKWSGSAGKARWVEHWEGDVFCAEVPNNTLYVRRRGKPVWSGNSVLEHSNFSFLLYGISRSVTHELVRHRAGVGFCLTGDTLVYSDHFCNGRRNGTKKRSMEQLYEMTKTPHGRSRLKLLQARSLDEATGVFDRGRVNAVVCSGVKPVFRVELEDGKSITCSRNHRFLTPDGWKPLHRITNGLEVSPGRLAVHGPLDTEIMVNGTVAYRDRGWLEEHYIKANLSTTEVADIAGVSTYTVKRWLRRYGIRKPLGVRTRWTFANEGKLYADREWLEEQYVLKGLEQEAIARIAGVSKHTIRSWVRKHGLQKQTGSWSIGRTPWNKGRRYKAGWTYTPQTRRRISEQKSGDKNPQWRGGITKSAITIRRGVNELRPQILERDHYRCRLCGSHSRQLDMHHIIPVWARPDLVLDLDNIATVCRMWHLKVNGREIESAALFGVIPDAADASKPRPDHKGRLFVPRAARIKSVSYAGEQMTYDLEMDGPNHNFVANGIVTHNSQISQRYVSGSVLRFVERPEYQEDEKLHGLFEERADRAAAEYEAMADQLLERQEGGASMLTADYKTDARKKVQQTARSLLPNETEAPMVFTGNVRALRHIIEMRADAHAESEIRNLALRLFLCLRTMDPILFGDYELGELPDGTYTVSTKNRKA